MDFLTNIVKQKNISVARLRKHLPAETLDLTISRPSFSHAIRKTDMAETRLIAEVKKASPSKGIFVRDFDPVALAGTYVRGGAAAISVITEEKFFLGSPDYLRAIADNFPDSPLLFKDFIIDLYQLSYAKSLGASAALLIVALLGDQLSKYLEEAGRVGIETLVEVHNAWELKIALKANAPIIGVNNRNLTTFKTSLSVSKKLIAGIPEGVITVAESGIDCRDAIVTLEELGFDAFLVGESIIRADDRDLKIAELTGRSN